VTTPAAPVAGPGNQQRNPHPRDDPEYPPRNDRAFAGAASAGSTGAIKAGKNHSHSPPFPLTQTLSALIPRPLRPKHLNTTPAAPPQPAPSAPDIPSSTATSCGCSSRLTACCTPGPRRSVPRPATAPSTPAEPVSALEKFRSNARWWYWGRPPAYQAHLTLQDVPQLRQLVQSVVCAEMSHSGSILGRSFNFANRSHSSRADGPRQVRLQRLIRAGKHRAEFQDAQSGSVTPFPLLGVERAPRTAFLIHNAHTPSKARRLPSPKDAAPGEGSLDPLGQGLNSF